MLIRQIFAPSRLWCLAGEIAFANRTYSELCANIVIPKSVHLYLQARRFLQQKYAEYHSDRQNTPTLHLDRRPICRTLRSVQRLDSMAVAMMWTAYHKHNCAEVPLYIRSAIAKIKPAFQRLGMKDVWLGR